MKKNLMITIFLLSFIAAKAQKVQLTWGQESKTEMVFNSFVKGKGNEMIKLSFEEHKGFFTKPTITPFLVRYNSKLEEAGVKSFGVDEKDIVFEKLLSVKNKLFMFTSQYDKDAKATNYFVQKVDIVSLEPIGQPISLGAFDAIRKTSTTTIDFSLSSDSSKILLFGIAPVSKKENQKYFIGVYDADMKKLWDQTVELPYLDKYIDIIDHVVTNEGKVGVLIKHYDQEVKKEAIYTDGEKIPAYKTKFLFYDQSKGKPNEYVLDFGGKFVHKLEVTSDNGKNLYLFGLYKNKYNGYVAGFFAATIDKSTNVVTTTSQAPFPQELIDQIRVDRQGSNRERDPGLGSEFTLAQVVDKHDGSKDYLLEYASEVFVPSTTTMSGGRMSSTASYWKYGYGDIIDLAVKGNGKVVITRVPKLQSTINVRSYSNFKALPYKDKLLIFYNDDADNITRDIAKKPESVDKFGHSVLAMAVIDDKGNLTREVVQENRNAKLVPAIRECHIIDNNTIGMYAQRGVGFFSAAKDMAGILEVK